MELYRERWFSDPRDVAQDALKGRTHYVDDQTLRFHKARVLYARVHYSGLLFSIIESVALDPESNRRGFRFVIFDVFGRVVGKRADLEHCWRTSEQASKALTAELLTLDPKAITYEAIMRAGEQYQADLVELTKQVAKIGAVKEGTP